jgi:uncharacterized membrane protein YczE
MHPNLVRDIPIALGIVAILIGIFRHATNQCVNTPDQENPQWFCRAVFYFVGTVLIGLGLVENFAPR